MWRSRSDMSSTLFLRSYYIRLCGSCGMEDPHSAELEDAGLKGTKEPPRFHYTVVKKWPSSCIMGSCLQAALSILLLYFSPGTDPELFK